MLYSNVPITPKSSNSTVAAFDNYYAEPVEMGTTVLAAMTGFFTSKGFGQVAAESIAITIITQSKRDGYNPMIILDTLRGLDNVEISALVSEILNYNRLKTSSLGYAQQISPNPEIQRNIILEPDVPLLVQTFNITARSEVVEEGSTIVFDIVTTNVPDGYRLFWDIVGGGISSSDFQDNLVRGQVAISNNIGTISRPIARDSTFEGDEDAVINLRSVSTTSEIVASTSFTIADTSFSVENIDFMVIEYTFTTGKDLDTRSRIVVPQIGTYVGWSWPPDPSGILQWAGDNTGPSGTESVAIDMIKFRLLYPNFNELIIDCRAQWFSEVGTTPVGLKITVYRGGSLVKENFAWKNPTSTFSKTLDSKLKIIGLASQSQTIGQRVATVKYNLLTGKGLINANDSTVYP
jgi:hypothetical protein